MVIALDIDGTIDRHPRFFAFMTQAFIAAGHEIIVITFRQDRQSAMADLAQWEIAYSRLITWSLDDCPAEEMMAWKGRLCEKLGVEVLFEDDPQVLCQVAPEVVGMMVVNQEEHELARLSK